MIFVENISNIKEFNYDDYYLKYKLVFYVIYNEYFTSYNNRNICLQKHISKNILKNFRNIKTVLKYSINNRELRMLHE